MGDLSSRCESIIGDGGWRRGSGGLLKMMNIRVLICAAAMLALFASTAVGDWKEGDPAKMHYPQLPDPQGLDVNMTWPKVLADDWLCTETGPVSDIHFWFSVRSGETANLLVQKIHVSIHKDIPAGVSPFSQPGDVVWQRDFSPDELRFAGPFTGDQGWYDPNTGLLIPHDHFTYGQVNITNIVDPFYQQKGEVYWLDLSIMAIGGQVGWKTSRSPHFLDDAVWSDYLPTGPDPYQLQQGWQELLYPSGASMDLAFVITPEPGTILMMPLLSLLALRRRR